MDFIQFVFRDVWTFFGFCLLVILGTALVKAVFDFIVELIHGKQVIQHVHLPEGTKVVQKEKVQKSTEDINGSVCIEPAEVSVRSN